jgi:hypothetical protein
MLLSSFPMGPDREEASYSSPTVSRKIQVTTEATKERPVQDTKLIAYE